MYLPDQKSGSVSLGTKGGENTILDTLTRFNTLIFQALGPNRQSRIMEAKIQHDNSRKYQRERAQILD